MSISASRRRFIEIAPFTGIALLAACSPKSEPVPVSPAPAPTPAPAAPTAGLPMVDAKDAQAVALGYVEDAPKADTARFKNYIAGNDCSNCVLYQGKLGEAAGPCPLFTGKNVAARGWCTSWAKKA